MRAVKSHIIKSRWLNSDAALWRHVSKPPITKALLFQDFFMKTCGLDTLAANARYSTTDYQGHLSANLYPTP
jgi:hypothetical protein